MTADKDAAPAEATGPEPEATEATTVEPDTAEPEAAEATTAEPDAAEATEPEPTAAGDDVDDVDSEAEPKAEPRPEIKTRATGGRSRVLAFAVLPAIALLLAVTAGALKWYATEADEEDAARAASLRAARETVELMFTYDPAQIDQQMAAARELLTGQFQETYTRMSTDIVIPRAKQEGIAASTSVPGAAIESVDEDHAVAMLYVNQKVSVGGGVPTDNLSTAKVTLDKVGDRWLVSQFQPV